MSKASYEKYLILLGHGYFLFFIVFSIIFFRERLIGFDSSFYTLMMIDNSDFYTGHQRYLSYLPQILPLLAFKSGASLKTIMQLYSVAFMLLYYAYFLISVYGFKNIFGGIFIALSLCLTLRYKYYVGVSETPLSIGMLAFFISWKTKEVSNFLKEKWWLDLGIGLLILIALLLGHPLMIMPMFAFLAVDTVYKKQWQNKQHWAVVVMVIIGYALRYIWVSQNSYEGAKMDILNNIEPFINKMSDYYIVDITKYYFLNEYHLPFLVFIGLLFYLFYHKKILSAILLFLASVAILFINMLTCSYLKTDVYNLYDGYNGMLGLIWALPILYALLPSRHRIVSAVLATLLLFFGTYKIAEKRTFFQNRMAYYQAIMDEHVDDEHRKIFVEKERFPWRTLWYPWGAPLETLLMTSLRGPEHSATIFIEDWGMKSFDNQLKGAGSFIGPPFAPNIFIQKELPPHLFQLPMQKYKIIKWRPDQEGKAWTRDGLGK